MIARKPRLTVDRDRRPATRSITRCAALLTSLVLLSLGQETGHAARTAARQAQPARLDFHGATVRALMVATDDATYMASTLAPRLKAAANINLKVDIVPYGEVRAKQLADRAGPKTHDIIDAYTEVSYEYRAFATDLTPYLRRSGYPQAQTGDVIPYVFKAWNPAATLNFMPYQPDTRLFWYRTDLLQKAGLQPPKTWADLLTHAKKLTGHGVYGWVMPSTRADPSITLAWVPIFLSAGGQLLDARGKPALNSKAGLDALNLLLQLKTYGPPDLLSYGYPETDQAFLQGRAAMGIEATAIGPQLEAAGSKVVGKMGAETFPTQKAGYTPAYYGIMGGWALGMSSYSAQKDATAYAVLYLTSPSVVTDWETHGRKHAARTSMLRSAALLKANPFIPQIVRALGRSELFYKGARSSNLQDVLTLRLSQALSGETSPQAALAAADADWARILGQ